MLQTAKRVLLLICVAAAIASPAAAQQVPSTVRVSGTVLDDGTPASGVTVKLIPVLDDYRGVEMRLAVPQLWADPVARRITADDGRYEFIAGAGVRWRLLVEAEDRAIVTRRLEPLFTDREVEPVVLRPGVTLEVHVRGPDGRPIAGARVVGFAEGYTEDLWPYSWDAGGTDLTGRVFLRLPDTAPWRFEAAARGFAPVDVEHPQGRRVDIMLRPSARLVLRLRLPSGAPAAGAIVVRPGKGIVLGQADARGRVEILGHPGLRQRIQILTRSDESLLTDVVFPEAGFPEAGEGREPLRLDLLPPHQLKLQVTTAGGTEPLPGAVAWARDDRVVRAQASGRLVLTVPATEEWAKLGVAAPGHLPWSMSRLSLHAADQLVIVGLEPTAALRGRVVDSVGRPVDGAAIQVVADSDSWSAGRFRDFKEGWDARSRDGGRFHFDSLPGAVRLRLGGVAPGLAETYVSLDPLEAHSERSGVLLVLESGRPASGIVLGPESRPIAGAVVERIPPREPDDYQRAHFPRTRVLTGLDGRFRLPDVGSGAFDLKISAPGFVTAEVPGVRVDTSSSSSSSSNSSDSSGPADLGRFHLDLATRLEALVVDEAGNPRGGIEVQLVQAGDRSFRRDRMHRETTDSRGRATFTDLEHGVYELRAATDGFAFAESGQVETPVAAPIRLVLRRGAVLRGRVVDTRAEAIAGAEVGVYQQEAGNRYLEATTDARGAFALQGLDAGRQDVKISAEGFCSESRRLNVLAGRDPEPLRAQVERCGIVSGLVTWPDGRPAANVRIEVTSTGDPDRRPATGFTDSLGHFAVDDIPLGRSVVQAKLGSSSVRKTAEVGSGRQILRLTLPRGVEISGRVVNELGEPVASAHVRLSPQNGVAPAWTEEDGSFRFTDVVPEDYRLEVRHPDFCNYEADDRFAVGSESVDGLVVRLRRGAQVVGQIQGIATEGMAGLRVELFRTAGPGRGSGPHRVAPDREGRFRIDRVGLGSFRAMASRDDETLAEARFEVADETEEVEILLRPLGGVDVRGRILRGGRGVARAHLFLRAEDGRTIDSRSAADGSFLLRRVPEGPARLEVNEHPDVREAVEVVVREGEELTVELPPGEVSGVLRDGATGQPISRGRVQLEDLSDASPADYSWRDRVERSVRTDSRGEFVFRSLPVGAYRLRYSEAEEGQALARFDADDQPLRGLELVAQPAANVTLALSREDGSIPTDELVSIVILDTEGFLERVGQEVSNQEGRISLDPIPRGEWVVWLFSETLAPQEITVEVPSAEIHVTLGDKASAELTIPELAEEGYVELDGTLVDRDGRTLPGQPAAANIWLYGGSATLSPLWPSDWALELRHPDGRVWTAVFTAVAGETTELVLE